MEETRSKPSAEPRTRRRAAESSSSRPIVEPRTRRLAAESHSSRPSVEPRTRRRSRRAARQARSCGHGGAAVESSSSRSSAELRTRRRSRRGASRGHRLNGSGRSLRETGKVVCAAGGRKPRCSSSIQESRRRADAAIALVPRQHQWVLQVQVHHAGCLGPGRPYTARSMGPS